MSAAGRPSLTASDVRVRQADVPGFHTVRTHDGELVGTLDDYGYGTHAVTTARLLGLPVGTFDNFDAAASSAASKKPLDRPHYLADNRDMTRTHTTTRAAAIDAVAGDLVYRGNGSRLYRIVEVSDGHARLCYATNAAGTTRGPWHPLAGLTLADAPAPTTAARPAARSTKDRLADEAAEAYFARFPHLRR